MSGLKLIPELYCSDLELTKKFYVDILGFSIDFERHDDQFVYFTLDDVDIMIECLSGPDRKWITGSLEKPYGRGVNFMWDVIDVDPIYERVKSKAPSSIYLDIEVKSYQCGEELFTQKQFIVQDPDGYLFRFCSEINT